MNRSAEALNDWQVAMFVQRGDSNILTLLQEEEKDLEQGFALPAKSFSIADTQGIITLRNMLNSLDLGGEEETEVEEPLSGKGALWIGIRKRALQRLNLEDSPLRHQVKIVLSTLVRATLGIKTILVMTEEEAVVAEQIVNEVVETMLKFEK
ncbi:hypothetical protein [Paenibacillus sp. JJ-100]|uniref:hypothetical protein n=1 Tax=Paenibacillus sp. JJ-100 TaxID=2974896 RepID=UPI00232E5EA6|nr:hypothetical protein [Paenibacillus sp. JJ-100]